MTEYESRDHGGERRGDNGRRADGAQGNRGRDAHRGPRRDDDQRPRRDGEQRPRREGDRRPRQQGDRPYRERGDQDRPYRSRDGEQRPRREGDRPYRERREGDRSYRSRDGEQRPRREGDRPYRSRGDQDRPYRSRDGEQRPRREGDRPYRERREGDRPYRSRDGEQRPRREGDRPYRSRDGEQRPRRDGDRPYRSRDGEQRPRRDGDRPQYGRGGTRGGGRSDRGGRDREFTEAERLQHELRPVRAEHDDPEIPDYIEAKDLHPGARNELKTLQPEIAERVARHLAMVAQLIEDEPELAHQHAISASRRAGRIPVVRETLAATAYRIGDYALTLRELRTHRRLSGDQGNIALMVEAERALGRPQKGIETGLEADTSKLSTAQRVQLAIAMSGARLDLGQTQQALFELDIPELDPERAFSYSPELFAAYAAVLEELGRDGEAQAWQDRALRAEAALNAELIAGDKLEVIEVIEYENQPEPETQDDAAGEAEPDDQPEAAPDGETDATGDSETAPEGESAPESGGDEAGA